MSEDNIYKDGGIDEIDEIFEIESIFENDYGVRHQRFLVELINDSFRYLPVLKKALDRAVGHRLYNQCIDPSIIAGKSEHSLVDILRLLKYFENDHISGKNDFLLLILDNCTDETKQQTIEALQWWGVLCEMHGNDQIPSSYCLCLYPDEIPNLQYKIDAVATWAGAWRYIEDSLKSDVRFITSVIENANVVEAFYPLVEKHSGNKDVMTAAILCRTNAFKFASEELRDDTEFVLALAEKKPDVSLYASPRLSDYLYYHRNRGTEVEALKAIIGLDRLGKTIPADSCGLIEYFNYITLKDALPGSNLPSTDKIKKVKV